MEQITKKDGVYYYGAEPCTDINDAYSRFRRDYHESLGRDVYGRLDRAGQRVERIHGFGFVFAGGQPDGAEFRNNKRVDCRLLGYLGIANCRILGIWDYGYITDEQFERWFDWALSRGSEALRLVGRKSKSGRTSKRLKKRFR